MGQVIEETVLKWYIAAMYQMHTAPPCPCNIPSQAEGLPIHQTEHDTNDYLGRESVTVWTCGSLRGYGRTEDININKLGIMK